MPQAAPFFMMFGVILQIFSTTRDGFFQLIQITNNYLLLMANTNKITDHFTFSYFKKEFIMHT